MTLTNLFSNEFLEQYKAGKREFSNINLQYADIANTNLDNIVIKDSRLFFVVFRSCSFKNAKFINCEIFYGTFYGGDLENFLMDKCAIDFTLFDNIVAKKTRLTHSKISWSAIFNSPTGDIDTFGSTLFKFFTHPSQLTTEDMSQAMSLVGPILDKLDISIKALIKKELERDAEKYNINVNNPTENKSEYGSSPRTGDVTSPTLYGAMQNLSDMVIGAYNAAHPYKTKRSYQDDSNASYR